jgi:hypothetical protein
MMGELDRPQSQGHHHPSMGLGATAAAPPIAASHTQVMAEQAPTAHHQVAMQMPLQVSPSAQQTLSYTEKTLMATSQPMNAMDLLDCSTKAMIQEVKEEFNLGSELEALRMLIKIGYVKS